ncbi:MAG: hypothetical protein KAS49_05600, partial [Candidatus Cloacimonetes bacterium]|nr:hypothetical protein [Candidatus Cloacimonadota bacterium]
MEIGRVGNTFGLNTLSVVSEDIHLYSKLTENWDEHLGTSKAFEGESTQPIFSADINADGNDENMIVSHDKLYTYDGQNIEVDEFESEITSSPLYLDDFQLLIIPTENKLHIGNDVLEISNARLAFDSEEIVAVSGDKIYFISIDGEINEEITISNLDEQFYPVCYDDSNDEYDATFVQDAKGDIWKIQNYQATKIFNLSGYSSELPTNLGIGDILQDNVPYLIFAAGDRTFAITTSGTLAPDFPGYLENRSFTVASFPKIVKFDEKVICYFASDQSYLSVDSHGDFVPE